MFELEQLKKINPTGKNHCFTSNSKEKCCYLEDTLCTLFDVNLDYKKYFLGDESAEVWFRCKDCKIITEKL